MFVRLKQKALDCWLIIRLDSRKEGMDTVWDYFVAADARVVEGAHF